MKHKIVNKKFPKKVGDTITIKAHGKIYLATLYQSNEEYTTYFLSFKPDSNDILLRYNPDIKKHLQIDGDLGGLWPNVKSIDSIKKQLSILYKDIQKQMKSRCIFDFGDYTGALYDNGIAVGCTIVTGEKFQDLLKLLKKKYFTNPKPALRKVKK